jgi:arsenate reductase
MAEGYARKYHPEWNIQSAGLEKHGLNPRAVQTMADDGLDISHQVSTLIDDDYLFSSDLIITLCGDANDKCPVTPSNIKRVHWDLEDPAKITGTEEEIAQAFAKTRDLIKIYVQNLE